MKLLKKLIKETDGMVPKIVEKSYKDKERAFDLPAAITLGLFEDMCNKVRSMITLIDNNRDASIDSTARSILENYFYLKLILSDQNEIYCRSYFLAKKYKELILYNSIKDKSLKGANIRKLIGITLEEIQHDTKKLGDPEKYFEKLKKDYQDVLKLRRVNTTWYNLDGKTKNIEQLCKKINKEVEYEVFYRILSQEVHSLDVLKRWEFEKDQVSLITNYQNKDMVVNSVGVFLLEIIRDIYDFYGLKKDLNNFNTNLRISYNLMKK